MAPQLLPEERDRAAIFRTTVFWAAIIWRPTSGGTLPAGSESCLRLVHHLLQKWHFHKRAVASAIEQYEGQTEEQERGLHDAHTFLPHEFVGHERQACAESKHLALILLALTF